MAHHAHHGHQDDEPLPPPAAVGHETSDAQAAPIIKFLAFLGIVTIVTAGLMVWFHNYLERREALEKTSRYPLAAGRPRPLPPPPRLQTYPFDDIQDVRRDERRRLDRYEWVDRNAGVVRIPVERAMDLIAERGLPHRSEAPPAAPGAGPGTMPGVDAGAAAQASEDAPAKPPAKAEQP